jgi:hypothetical protein
MLLLLLLLRLPLGRLQRRLLLPVGLYLRIIVRGALDEHRL